MRGPILHIPPIKTLVVYHVIKQCPIKTTGTKGVAKEVAKEVAKAEVAWKQ